LKPPIFEEVINMGKITGKTILQQVLEQLELYMNKDYVWWNNDKKIKVTIPNDVSNTQAIDYFKKQ
jgi:hypothetical protein